MVIEDILTNLLSVYRKDPKEFYNLYRTLPLDIYTKIEHLSMSKSTLYRDLCNKAKSVTKYFHRKF